MGMTIDEAIKANEDTVVLLTEKGLVRKAEAAQIGIEALQRVKGNRLYAQPTVHPRLPGETEE